VAAGRRSKAKGRVFERQIARELRAVYDTPELCARIAAATNADRKKHMSESSVRRGEQGRNAHEPDIVAPCPWWFELHTGTQSLGKKLEQARDDAELHHRRGGRRWTKAVAVHRAKGSQNITASMMLSDLLKTIGVTSRLDIEMPVTVDFYDFLELLRLEKERGQG